MGIALRVREADGACWSLICDGGLNMAAGLYWVCEEKVYDDDVEEGRLCSCNGDDSGELLAFDDRSDEAALTDCSSSSVNKAGQNSRSSSRSNPLAASYLYLAVANERDAGTIVWWWWW
jgi:hypothetical protein